MTASLEVLSVEKKIEDFLLGPINLTLESGTVTALIGNNGAGKSTLENDHAAGETGYG